MAVSGSDSQTLRGTRAHDHWGLTRTLPSNLITHPWTHPSQPRARMNCTDF